MIDTPAKRRSVFGWGVQPMGLIPDGTIAAGDRVHVSGRYSGIAIGEAVVPEFIPYRATVALRNAYGATVEA
jgi:hypothetical protein